MENVNFETKNSPEGSKLPQPFPWKLCTLLVLVFLVLGAGGFYLYHESSFENEKKQTAVNLATAQPAQGASLQDLMSNATIHFSSVDSKKALAPNQSLSEDISLFINKNAVGTDISFLNYQDETIGFYATYSVPAALAAQLYQADSAAAKSSGWQILYGASSSQAAVLEASKESQPVVYKAQLQYENQVDGSVDVVVQYDLQSQPN
jgi:hypothetical protein